MSGIFLSPPILGTVANSQDDSRCADRLHAEGWSYGIAEHLTKHGLLFCVDAHRDGKRFIVKADDLLTAFLSLERDLIAPKALTGTRCARTSPRSTPLNLGTKVVLRALRQETMRKLNYSLPQRAMFRL